ncbi:carboxylesterase family protein [Streptomyces sp. 5K101]|uniref:carboxylesterase family protein n=1 Tax=Streptomyces sp. 5K101 TaxID=3390037 RepID=UPI0039762BD1
MRTSHGWVRGAAGHDGGRVFQGIPFAAPPTGERRWRPPQPVARWSGVRDTTAPTHPCPQLPLTPARRRPRTARRVQPDRQHHGGLSGPRRFRSPP